jgi:DNA-binding response OmpR family regulator
MRHHRDEVRDAIDQFAEYNTIKVHLHNIRKKLRPRGQDIIFEAHRWGVYYRHVRLLHDSSRE